MADVEGLGAGVLERAGWRVGQVFAVGQAPHFWAFYDGEDFGHRERGLLAVLATAHAGPGDDVVAARRSAQLVAYNFAEGFYGARRTFGPKRAAGLALESMNSWLFGQVRADNAQYFAPVSVMGLIFAGPLVGIAHVGAGRLYRRRAGRIVPLTRAHVRYGGNGQEVLRRAVGLDNEISVDFFEEAAEAGDEFLMLAGPAEEGTEGLGQVFDLATGDKVGNAGVGAAMRLMVLAAPPPDAARHLGDLQTLPIRPPPREGDVWDGFKIGRTIYRGRYTLLKAARDLVENRDVALKIPLPTMLQDEVFAAGFMREAWIGTTIRGENIARYIDLPEDRRSSLYLVMPFYAGETLEARLGRAPLVSLPDGVGIALKLCEAVQDLAAIQVIHRDIKPDNILLLPGNKVKLIDLGLAYLPGIDVAEAVRPGGTLRYMAPELLKGVQANARSEVFALAVTFYRMFSGGAFPFGQREGVPLARMRPDLPAWLGRVLQRGFAEDAAARFADAGEMASALQEGLVTGESDAPPPAFSVLGFSALQLWRGAAVGFGVAFLGLLVRVLRG
jgi:hypothetical protein